jgi:hypothetical protein
VIVYNGHYEYRKVLAQAPGAAPAVTIEPPPEAPKEDSGVPLWLLALAATGTALFIWAASSSLARNGR